MSRYHEGPDGHIESSKVDQIKKSQSLGDQRPFLALHGICPSDQPLMDLGPSPRKKGPLGNIMEIV